MAVTMEKVAKMAGISRTAVSYVLKDCWREKGLSEETYRRVMDVVQKSNYRPNRVATSLANRKTRVIGVQVPSFLYEYNNNIVKGLDKCARKYGYHILLAAPAAWQDEAGELARLYEHQVDGLILNPQVPGRMEKILNQLKADNVRMVFIGNVPEGSEYFVTDDHMGQSEMAVDHLVALGHRRIAHICGPVGHQEGEKRKLGYAKALKKHGLPVLPEYMELGSFEFDWAAAAAQRLVNLPQPPTAIYCANDPMAVAAIQAIEKAGLRVPDDISVLGHGDDIPFSSFTKIPLTTIAQQPEGTAELAMKMIIDLVEGRKVENKKNILPGKLIVRNSSGPPF
jgi:DNA-binding LacI/PurR family transcriptional regulator